MATIYTFAASGTGGSAWSSQFASRGILSTLTQNNGWFQSGVAGTDYFLAPLLGSGASYTDTLTVTAGAWPGGEGPKIFSCSLYGAYTSGGTIQFKLENLPLDIDPGGTGLVVGSQSQSGYAWRTSGPLTLSRALTAAEFASVRVRASCTVNGAGFGADAGGNPGTPVTGAAAGTSFYVTMTTDYLKGGMGMLL